MLVAPSLRRSLPALLLCPAVAAFQATVVPNEVQLPGTQPLEVSALIAPSNCHTCHGGYDAAVEPSHGWMGSAMAQAARDPLFWATVAVSEQDFAGSGDLCLRCHIAQGWIAGRSTPTDGSGMTDADATGVSCHLCHRMTNPDGSEHVGVQNVPYIANDGGAPPEAFLGSGMYVLSNGGARLGPYSDATSAPHAVAQSDFHRSVEFCGTCHDVSNPVTGDLAPTNGAQVPLAPGTFSGVPGAALVDKAAFQNFPHAYGTVERTFSEHVSSAFPATLVSDYATLPAELRAGSIRDAHDAAVAVRPDGNYADGAPRTFTCQTCHMRPRAGKGAKQPSAPVRTDLGLHDLTGGNGWLTDVLLNMDSAGTLPLGPALSGTEVTALLAGKQRTVENLQGAAALEVQGDVLRVYNLTGHKLITGYPEGRRMWLRIAWFDAADVLLREDGAYGSLTVQIAGMPTQVDTILDLDDPELHLYAAHPGMTQEWAALLVGLGYPAGLALTYDRVTGAVVDTLGDLASSAAGTTLETFHFALNDALLIDTRIPPYGMRYDDALERNILPVPAGQYGDPGPGGTFRHWDEITLNPPAGAARADVELLYQPTSWEYVRFLDLANTGQSALLADVGGDLQDAWLQTGMAAPVVMASTTWEEAPPFASSCSGDGGDQLGCTDCPCANEAPVGTLGGCLNSAGSAPRLDATGDPSVSLPAGSTTDLRIGLVGAPPTAFCVLTSGDAVAPTNPANVCFGLDSGIQSILFDGLRCAVGNTQRHGGRPADAAGTVGVTTNPWGGVGAPPAGLAAAAGFAAGQTRWFQAVHRDDPALVCMRGLGTTQAVEVTFAP